jgi:uncharacterized membrane protein
MPYLWIMAFCIVTLIALLYLRVGILLTCCKHLHDIIVSLGGEVWAHQTVGLDRIHDKMKNEKCHTIGTVSKKGKIDISNSNT